jgi:hypothetical protein
MSASGGRVVNRHVGRSTLNVLRAASVAQGWNTLGPILSGWLGERKSKIS